MQEIPFAFTTTAEAIGAVADDYAFVGPLTVEGHVVHTGSCWRAEGVIRCTKSYVCDRCLAPCQEEQEHPAARVRWLMMKRPIALMATSSTSRSSSVIPSWRLSRSASSASLIAKDSVPSVEQTSIRETVAATGLYRIRAWPPCRNYWRKIRNETVRRCIRDGSTKAQNFEGTPRPAPCKLEARGSWLRSLPAVPRTEDASSCMPGMRLL